METIKYADNWNGKLLCNTWPDVRLPFDHYAVGNVLEVHHQHLGTIGKARIISILPITYEAINDNMAYTVIGNNAAYLKKMLYQFYGDRLQRHTKMLHIIFQMVERNPETLHNLMERQYSKHLSITPKATQYADGPHQQ